MHERAMDAQRHDDQPLPDLTLREAAARLKGSHPGKRVHTATITRWIIRGVKTPTGERIMLRAVRMPACWLTSERWIAEFAEALTHARLATPKDRQLSVSAESRRAHACAERELDKIGV